MANLLIESTVYYLSYDNSHWLRGGNPLVTQESSSMDDWNGDLPEVEVIWTCVGIRPEDAASGEALAEDIAAWKLYDLYIDTIQDQWKFNK